MALIFCIAGLLDELGIIRKSVVGNLPKNGWLSRNTFVIPLNMFADGGATFSDTLFVNDGYAAIAAGGFEGQTLKSSCVWVVVLLMDDSDKTHNSPFKERILASALESERFSSDSISC